MRGRKLEAAVLGMIALAVGVLQGCDRATPAVQGPPGMPPRQAAPSPSLQPFDNGGPCPAATGRGLPPDAGCLSQVEADLDGDQAMDRFLLYAQVGVGARPRSWEARAVLSTTGVTPAAAVPTGQGVEYVYPKVISAVDANGDGRAEVFVELSAILYHVGGQRIDGIYGVADGRVIQVRVKGRGTLELRTGGIGPYGDGGLCADGPDGPRFVLLHVRRAPSNDWSWTEREFRWEGMTLVPVETRRGALPGSLYATDPAVHRFYQLRCGPLLTS